jgi:hypothetical protein
MDEILGGIVTIGVGIIIVAAIYQLSQTGNPTLPDVTNILKRSEKAMFT